MKEKSKKQSKVSRHSKEPQRKSTVDDFLAGVLKKDSGERKKPSTSTGKVWATRKQKELMAGLSIPIRIIFGPFSSKDELQDLISDCRRHRDKQTESNKASDSKLTAVHAASNTIHTPDNVQNMAQIMCSTTAT